MGDEPTYPFVDCDDHGRQPGYIVCIHLLNNPRLPVAHVLRATDKETGEILCAACSGRPARAEDLKIVCAGHAEELLLVPARRMQ